MSSMSHRTAREVPITKGGLASFRQPCAATLITMILRVCVGVFYRLRVNGTGNIPARGGFVLVSNYVSYLDVVLLTLLCPRAVRILGYNGLRRRRIMRWLFRLFEVIPTSPKRAREAIDEAVGHVRRGGVVGILPEGHISRDGKLKTFGRGVEIIARRAGVPVVPVRLDSL